VELIIEKRTWAPPPPRWQADTQVAIQVVAPEREVRQQVKAAGGKWNSKEVVWELPYGQVGAWGLTDRIVPKADPGEQNVHILIDGTGRERPSANR
jgi:hypothetical protein